MKPLVFTLCRRADLVEIILPLRRGSRGKGNLRWTGLMMAARAPASVTLN